MEECQSGHTFPFLYPFLQWNNLVYLDKREVHTRERGAWQLCVDHIVSEGWMEVLLVLLLFSFFSVYSLFARWKQQFIFNIIILYIQFRVSIFLALSRQFLPSKGEEMIGRQIEHIFDL